MRRTKRFSRGERKPRSVIHKHSRDNKLRDNFAVRERSFEDGANPKTNCHFTPNMRPPHFEGGRAGPK